MKELKFKTSKGRFVVVDKNSMDYLRAMWNYDLICKLSEITEEQASDIVDSHNNCKRYFYKKEIPQKYYNNAISCLHSLLKSKGIHLFINPVPEPEIQGGYTPDGDFLGGYDDQWIADYEEAEQKTFYNPYIFKIND